jgi:hypothetical protein
MVNREWLLTERWARIGPNDKSWLIHVPKAGLCLSAFVVIRRRDSILLGRPHAQSAWPEKGGFPERHAAAIEEEGSWLLPATHLLMEEAPHHAAKRIANQWAGVTGTPKFVMVQSHLRPSKLRPEPRWHRKLNHWDICFVYELQARVRLKRNLWWSDLRFFKAADIAKMKLARGHKDVLRAANYV